MFGWPLLRSPQRNGFVVLLTIISLMSVLLIMGMMASGQASSARRTLETIQAKRLMDLAAASAFEEASAWLEANLPPLVLIGDDQQSDEQEVADENKMEKFHEPIDPAITRRSLAGQGIEISPVSALSSPWKIFDETDSQGQRTGLAFGIIELTVTVRVTTEALKSSREITVRRYVTVNPTPGARTAPVLIQPNNLVVLIKGA